MKVGHFYIKCKAIFVGLSLSSDLFAGLAEWILLSLVANKTKSLIYLIISISNVFFPFDYN
jgi:hypothetical protein